MVRGVKKTKKRIVKKSTKKAVKRVTKKAKKIIKKTSKKENKAQGGERFFLVDGSMIHDLRGLADSLDNMGHEVFYHHVTEIKNDFANWVREIMKEKKLADKLMQENSPERCQIVVLRHISK